MSEGVVVIGASGGIGAALVAHWLAAGVGPVIAISPHQQEPLRQPCTGYVVTTAMSR